MPQIGRAWAAISLYSADIFEVPDLTKYCLRYMGVFEVFGEIRIMEHAVVNLLLRHKALN
jgi:hypothetical protein